MMNQALSEQYGLGDLDDYHYVNESAMDAISEEDDAKALSLLDKCMNVLFESESEKDAVFSIVASILNLGNVEVEETHIPGQ